MVSPIAESRTDYIPGGMVEEALKPESKKILAKVTQSSGQFCAIGEVLTQAATKINPVPHPPTLSTTPLHFPCAFLV